MHTATFVANPLSCATALVVLEVLKRDRLPKRAAELGQLITSRTERWSGAFEPVIDVRGLGLAWGIELDSRGTAQALVEGMLTHGLLALAGGPTGKVVQICPPLVVTDLQLAFALDSVETLLRSL